MHTRSRSLVNHVVYALHTRRSGGKKKQRTSTFSYILCCDEIVPKTLGDDVQKREILYKFPTGWEICKITLRANSKQKEATALASRQNVFWVKDLDGEERETELDVFIATTASDRNRYSRTSMDFCPQNTYIWVTQYSTLFNSPMVNSPLKI